MRGSRKISIKKYVILIVIMSFVLPMAMAQSSGAPLVPTQLDENQCYDCHSDSAKVDDTSAADKWADSIHYENEVGCERCHSASVPAGRLAVFGAFGGSYRDDHVDIILEPEVSYKAPSAFGIEGSNTDYSVVVRGGLTKQQSVAMCARCHGLTPITPESPKNVFPDYLSSIHGQSVVVQGLGDPEKVGESYTGNIDSAVCTDCHDAHATKSKDDPTSETYKDNVPASCGTENCHGSDEVATKYGIVNALKTYENTHHGKGLKLGVEGVPTCINCHVSGISTHRILSQTDTASSTHPDNRAESCADEKCHGVELNVGGGSLHGKDADSTIGNLIDLFYILVIPATVGFFALYILLDFTLLLGKKGGE